jgi:formyl-CoA transferase
MGREDLSSEQRYATRENRTKNMDEVDGLVQGWCKERTVEEVIAALNKFQVPCSPVPTFDQVASDSQLLSRDMIVEVDQPVSGKVKLTGSVYKMSKTPGDRRKIIPAVGEHNEEIYGGLLGIDAQEMQKLKEEGVI